MNIKSKMMEPVSIAGLIWFRILFGFIMLWEVFRYFLNGWIESIFIKPTFHFKFFGFEWLPDIPAEKFFELWFAMGVLSFFIMIGLYYRISIILFTILFSYQFLIEQANYLNHFYFICLMSFAMCFLDPHLAISWDYFNNKVKGSAVVPFWQHWILCFIMGVVYFFGGIAKIDPDWMTGVPLNTWLDPHASVPVIGNLLKSDLSAVIISWIGVLLDLFIVPALIYKKTRFIAFIFIVIFHISNHFLFQIGIFPWFSIATTLLFFGPDFPLKVLKKLKLEHLNPLRDIPAIPIHNTPVWVKAILVFFVAYNLIMPLRHHFYPGDVHWNERGHAFSWRMKLRNKSGSDPVFHIKNLVTGLEWKENATKRLTRKQSATMEGAPEMIVQYVNYLRDVLKKEGHEKVQIKVETRVSLNSRKRIPIIKTDYRMEDVTDCVFCAPDWIAQLETERSWEDSYYRLKQRLASGE